jgi:hypothetical protein
MTAEYKTTLSMVLAALCTNSFVLCLHCIAWKLPYFVSALCMTSVSGAKSSDVVARRPRNDSFVSSSVNTVTQQWYSRRMGYWEVHYHRVHNMPLQDPDELILNIDWSKNNRSIISSSMEDVRFPRNFHTIINHHKQNKTYSMTFRSGDCFYNFTFINWCNKMTYVGE